MASANTLLSCSVFQWSSEKPILLWQEQDVTSFNFFARTTAREQLLFHSRLVVQRTDVGSKQSITLEQGVGVCHVFVHHSGLAACCITSPDYPARVAHEYVATTLKDFFQQFGNEAQKKLTEDSTSQFTWSKGTSLFNEFKDPLEADKLTQVNKELDQVKDVMLQNIEDLLQRGEEMENLMAKTSDLSNASVEFYKRAKANNQCCAMGV